MKYDSKDIKATPTTTLPMSLRWHISDLEHLSGTGLLADEQTILAQLKACAKFRGQR